MTITQILARKAIKWLARLAEPEPPEPEPEEPPEDELPPWQMTPTIRAALQAEAIARQARVGRSRYQAPPKPDPIETDSHLRYTAPKKPKKPRTRKQP